MTDANNVSGSFIFRVDASREIGSGHVMRCLALADSLRRQGHSCTFVSRPLQGNLIDDVRARGFNVVSLGTMGVEISGAGGSVPAPRGPWYEGWLQSGWRRDAAETAAVVSKLDPSWLIVDHYGIDARWENEVRNAIGPVKVLVIDDLADRDHDADVLVDQNQGRAVADYATLTPEGCEVLAGPGYALLREEFSTKRREALVRRANHGQTKNCLVNFGGVDNDNITAQVIRLIQRFPEAERFRFDVVMGRTAPHLADVERVIATSDLDVRLHVDAHNMAQLMARADFSIGAGGSSSWERCCMGLPSLVVALAENQRGLTCSLAASGAAVAVDVDDLESSLESGWRELFSPGRLRSLSLAAARLADGRGVDRVTARLQARGVGRA